MVNSYLIPDFLAELDSDLQTGWIEIYREVYSSYGEHLAKIAANKWLIARLDERQIESPELETDMVEEKEEPISEEKKPITISFTVDANSGEFIKHDADGNDYIDLVIADNLPVQSGFVYSEELLKKWADQINSGAIDFFGTDDDHELYDLVAQMYSHNPELAKEKLAELKEQNSIAKGVKALVDKGRLWLKMIIDKRYKKQLQNKKVSIEAFVNRGDVKQEGDLLGLSFLTRTHPDNMRAQVVA